MALGVYVSMQYLVWGPGQAHSLLAPVGHREQPLCGLLELELVGHGFLILSDFSPNKINVYVTKSHIS